MKDVFATMFCREDPAPNTWRCGACRGFGKVAGPNEYELVPCVECNGTGEPPPPLKPPGTAIVAVPKNHIPGLVDMNELRLAIDLVHSAINLTLYDVSTVQLESDGALKLREYDRISALLRHYGVINARIAWHPETCTIGIS